MGLDVVGLMVVGLDVVGLDVVELSVVGLDNVELNIDIDRLLVIVGCCGAFGRCSWA